MWHARTYTSAGRWQVMCAGHPSMTQSRWCKLIMSWLDRHQVTIACLLPHLCRHNAIAMVLQLQQLDAMGPISTPPQAWQWPCTLVPILDHPAAAAAAVPCTGCPAATLAAADAAAITAAAAAAQGSRQGRGSKCHLRCSCHQAANVGWAARQASIQHGACSASRVRHAAIKQRLALLCHEVHELHMVVAGMHLQSICNRRKQGHVTMWCGSWTAATKHLCKSILETKVAVCLKHANYSSVAGIALINRKRPQRC